MSRLKVLLIACIIAVGVIMDVLRDLVRKIEWRDR
jgi:hypothetical protein